MWKILGWIIIVGTALAVIKLALVMLVLAALIWRPKETLGLLAIGAGLALFKAHPAAGIGVVTLIAILAFYAASRVGRLFHFWRTPMHSIYDDTSAAAVLAQPLDPELRTLIEGRLADAAAIGLGELTHILVIQPGDTEATLIEEVGWSPLVNPIDGIRYNAAGFIPYWSWLEHHDGWWEMLHPVGNDGFAYILLIQQAEGVLTELLHMCAEQVYHC